MSLLTVEMSWRRCGKTTKNQLTSDIILNLQEFVAVFDNQRLSEEIAVKLRTTTPTLDSTKREFQLNLWFAHTHTHTHTHTFIHTHIYEGGMKSSYDDVISAVDDCYDQWDPSTVTPTEEV